MSRSLKKGPFFSQSLINKIKHLIELGVQIIISGTNINHFTEINDIVKFYKISKFNVIPMS